MPIHLVPLLLQRLHLQGSDPRGRSGVDEEWDGSPPSPEEAQPAPRPESAAGPSEQGGTSVAAQLLAMMEDMRAEMAEVKAEVKALRARDA